MPQIEVIAKKVEILRPLLDERLLRLWAATEAQALGHGGITAVAAATGLSRTTISAGIAQIESGAAAESDGRVRRLGGGRKRKETHDPRLLAALDFLVEPGSRGGSPSRRFLNEAFAFWRFASSLLFSQALSTALRLTSTPAPMASPRSAPRPLRPAPFQARRPGPSRASLRC